MVKTDLGHPPITDNITGTSDSQSCAFTYDDLGRSAGVNCGSMGDQSFSYDSFGNISKTANGVGSSFQPASYDAANQPAVSGMSFDTVGNTTTDNLRNSYTWDPNWGTMTSVGSISATYDALGRMVEQGSGSTYTEVLYSPAGKTAIMSGTTLTEAFVPLPGGGTAIYNSSGLAYYRHADWLGSSRLTSTPSRTLHSSTAYAPFGEQYAASGTADPSFTGQNSDTVPSLYDFLFRRQSPSQGRWISPDPAGLAAVDPSNPQSWNRYAYVANNPLGFVDPLGLVDSIYCSNTYDKNGNITGNTCNVTVSGYTGCVAYGTEGCITAPAPSGPPPPITLGGGPGPGGAAGSSGRAPSNGTPVHGLWTYGHHCGAGGSGNPTDPTDAACMAHDACYAQAGFSPGSNFQGSNAQLQACNQQLCNAVNARRNSLTQSLGHSWLPAVPPANVSSEISADQQISLYFTYAVAPWGNSCH